MEPTGAEVAHQYVEVLRGSKRLLEPIEQRSVMLIGEESGIRAHRSPLLTRCVLFK